MTTYQRLSKVQRNFVVAVFLAWLAGFLSTLTGRPLAAFIVLCISILVMLAAFIYFYRSARCPHCGEKLWLKVGRIVPLGPFKPKVLQCPSCGVSVHEKLAEA
jgi:DNA-directed RNA polymerase subunit RPC12/RpoP